jgi:hypothetical protein
MSNEIKHLQTISHKPMDKKDFKNKDLRIGLKVLVEVCSPGHRVASRHKKVRQAPADCGRRFGSGTLRQRCLGCARHG